MGQNIKKFVFRNYLNKYFNIFYWGALFWKAQNKIDQKKKMFD